MKSNLLKALVKVGWRIVGNYCLWMKRCANHPEKYPIDYKYKKLRNIVSKVAPALDMDIHVNGLENVPNETCAFFSNHVAAVDPLPIIMSIEKPLSFLAKSELEHTPIASTGIKDIEGLFLKRDDLKQSLRTMMKIEEELKENKKNWLVFPEGTRNKDDRATLLEFHHGTFRPAVKAGVPIVPIAIFGTQRVFAKYPSLKKYPVHLYFLKPIYQDEYKDLSTQDVALLVQSRIQVALTYKARKDDRAALVKLLGNNFKENL